MRYQGLLQEGTTKERRNKDAVEQKINLYTPYFLPMCLVQLFPIFDYFDITFFW